MKRFQRGALCAGLVVGVLALVGCDQPPRSAAKDDGEHVFKAQADALDKARGVEETLKAAKRPE